ncbi:hypothetical protein PN446_13775 [Microcystis aeruginosa CS-567/02]|nr:hypothetical protein [Microcystis aeruginosa CS-567/02]
MITKEPPAVSPERAKERVRWGNGGMGKWGNGGMGEWGISTKTPTPPATARLSVAEGRTGSDHPNTLKP